MKASLDMPKEFTTEDHDSKRNGLNPIPMRKTVGGKKTVCCHRCGSKARVLHNQYIVRKNNDFFMYRLVNCGQREKWECVTPCKIKK